MKKYLLAFVMLIFSTNTYAQKDVTKFMGIPVDGFKQQMFKQLKDKGFVASEFDKDWLEGEFNGENVIVGIATNNNKVYRIALIDKILRNETDIKIRYNRLCQQFIENQNYITLYGIDDYIIPEDEDLSYEIIVNKKNYEASFYQKPQDIDTINLEQKFNSLLTKKYSKEQIDKPSDEVIKTMLKEGVNLIFDAIEKKSVWFTIKEEGYDKYKIIMFYDNEYNKANGEDL